MEVERVAGMPVSALAREDIPGALRLVEESRWNQVAADWELFIGLGSALKVSGAGGAVIATAAILPYPPRFGWISMVLVAQEWRRRGIASEMLQLCVQRLRASGLVPVLDATPAGREVYRPIGFRDGWPITRWRRPPAPGAAALPRAGLQARPLRDEDWPLLAALDAEVFGADRGGLLRGLAARSSGVACVVEREGAIAGFLLGRDGRVARQLGPLVAEDDDAAHALLAHALEREHGPLLLDTLDTHKDFRRLLALAGFAIERPYTRMALDADMAFGDARRTVAIAGPELG